jgi:hypothetical protein
VDVIWELIYLTQGLSVDSCMCSVVKTAEINLSTKSLNDYKKLKEEKPDIETSQKERTRLSITIRCL